MATKPDILRVNSYAIDRSKSLGGRSFGVLYKGYDSSGKRDVCAKQIIGSSIEFSEREVQSLRRASDHWNIVQIYDSITHGGGMWVVMEYYEGETLDQYMNSNDPDLNERIEIIFQTAGAVKYMHLLTPPLVHQDIKPANIMYKVGLAKLCDFGLAKTIEQSGALNASSVGGSPIYLPPEMYSRLVKYNALKGDIFPMGLVFLGTITFPKRGAKWKIFFDQVSKLILMLLLHCNQCDMRTTFA